MSRHGYLLPTRGFVTQSDDPSELAQRVGSEVTTLAQRAETVGFDALWVGDSVLAKPRAEALITLASVAAVTNDVELGTAVYLPALRHPIHVAHQVATLGQLAVIQLNIGVGVTSDTPQNRHEHKQLGIPFDSRGSYLDEVLDIVTRFWRGDRFDYDGKHFTFEDVTLGFEPLQTPNILIASSKFDPRTRFPPRILRRIVTHGDGWLPIAISPEQYRSGLSTVRETVSDQGRDPNNIDPAFYQDVVIADSSSAAVEMARPYLERYYGHSFEKEEIRSMGTFGTLVDVKNHVKEYTKAGVETFVTRFPVDRQADQLQLYSSIFD